MASKPTTGTAASPSPAREAGRGLRTSPLALPTHPRSRRSAVPGRGRCTLRRPAEPQARRRGQAHPPAAVACSSQIPFSEEAFRGSAGANAAPASSSSSPFFSFSRLKSSFTSRILLPGLTQAARGRKLAPPAPGLFKVRWQHRGEDDGGAPYPGAHGGTGKVPEPAPLQREGADAELPPGAQSLYKQRG